MDCNVRTSGQNLSEPSGQAIGILQLAFFFLIIYLSLAGMHTYNSHIQSTLMGQGEMALK